MPASASAAVVAYNLNQRGVMQSNEALNAKAKAFFQRRREEAENKLRSAQEHGITYSEEHRAHNLRMLRRALDDTQESFASLLGFANQKALSLVETGEKALSAGHAREIESGFKLPENWLDRDNLKSMFLSQDELALVNELRRAKPGVALKLAETVKLLSDHSD